MNRLPWLPPARHRTEPPRPARPAQPPPVHATYVRPAPGTAWEHTRWQWEDREAAVLHLLADAGGDLTAHRTVHLEDR